MKKFISKSIKRKVYVFINMLALLLLSATMLIIGIFDATIILAIIGVLTIWAPFYGFKILFAKEVLYENDSIKVGHNYFSFNSIVFIEKIRLNIILKFLWSTHYVRSHTAPWDTYVICYKINGVEKRDFL